MVLNSPRQFGDSVTTVVRCEDGTCLCVFENNLVSLPTTRVGGNSTWQRQCMDDVAEACGLDVSPTSIIRVHKIWIQGHSSPYTINITYLIHISSDQKKKSRSASGKFSGKLKWLSENELQKYYVQDAICSPIILELFPKILTDKIILYPAEFLVTHNLIELTENALIDGYNDHFEITFDNSGLKACQVMLYKEFINISFPSILMPASGFCKFIIDMGMPKEDALSIFKAADISNRRFLSYRDFMYILAILEPTTNHGGISGEVRCRYIFRFFDRDRDGVINFAELKGMIIHMRKQKGLPVDAGNVEKEQKAYSMSLNVNSVKPMTLPDFLRYAGELKIRGLSQVLRLTKSMKVNLQNTSLKDSKNRMVSVEKTLLSTAANPYMKRGTHEIGVHSIRIQKSGTVINLEDIWSLKEVSSCTTLQQANITRESRRLSCETNNQESVCNELLKYLRHLAVLNKIKSGNRGNRKEIYQWGTIDTNDYSNKLTQICVHVRNIFRNEHRLLDLKSPIYVLGDFHGNFGDLQYFEKMFWPLGPGFCPSDLLFLGDYVDRGQFGIEIVSYIFCYKLLYPHKLHLIRGNHEIREVQKTFTFYAECVTKFGEKVGQELWDSINSAFDVMPISALVDGKIFCCHGGIPPPWLCPIATAINNVPVVLNEPDIQSSLAWEILWNDPIKDKNITPDVDAELKANEGFATNVKRGTAHVFSSSGLDRFLTVNGFSHVIRAHEMALMGYSVSLKGKVITIFSTSKYTGQNNEAACVLIENGKLRIMRLDTIY